MAKSKRVQVKTIYVEMIQFSSVHRVSIQKQRASAIHTTPTPNMDGLKTVQKNCSSFPGATGESVELPNSQSYKHFGYILPMDAG